jgi:two-component system KDP operon response regulator KdpE
MEKKPINALVVDDEPQIQRLLRTSLAAQHVRTFEADTAARALELLAAETIDVIVLDLGLPDRDGLDILAQIRATSSVPIIILSVLNDDEVKVEALDVGADDYLAKPFSTVELAARIRSVLRRRPRLSEISPILCCGDLTIDVAARRVTRGGREIKLSRTEYALLLLFAEHCGKVLTHDFILEKIWGSVKHRDLQYLRVYIRSLRTKIGDRIGEEELIRTEPRLGYRMAPPDELEPAQAGNG